MSYAETQEGTEVQHVIVRMCEQCRFAMDGVEGHKSGDAVLKGERTHMERYPDHQIRKDRYEL